jgi:hypothetical protein
MASSLALFIVPMPKVGSQATLPKLKTCIGFFNKKQSVNKLETIVKNAMKKMSIGKNDLQKDYDNYFKKLDKIKPDSQIYKQIAWYKEGLVRAREGMPAFGDLQWI